MIFLINNRFFILQSPVNGEIQRGSHMETQYPHTIPPKYSLKSPPNPNLISRGSMNEEVKALKTRK